MQRTAYSYVEEGLTISPAVATYEDLPLYAPVGTFTLVTDVGRSFIFNGISWISFEELIREDLPEDIPIQEEQYFEV